jgi:hypothetical protein
VKNQKTRSDSLWENILISFIAGSLLFSWTRASDSTCHHYTILLFAFLFSQGMGRKGKEDRALGICDRDRRN